MKYFFIFTVLYLGYGQGFSQESIIIDGKQEIIGLNHQLSYFQDKSSNFRIEQIQSDSFQVNFKPFPKGDVLNLGVTTAATWLKMKIEVKTDQTYYLQIDNPYLDSVFFYFMDNHGNYKYKLTGKKLPTETEDIVSTHCIIELPAVSNPTVQTFYIRLVSNRFMYIDAKIISQKNILNFLTERYVIDLIYFGIILLAVFYNLFMFFSVRDIAFFYYVIYTLCMGLSTFTTRGYLSLFFGDYREFIGKYTYFFSSLYPIFVLLFTLAFLKVKMYSQWLYKVLIIFLIFSLLRTLLNFLGYGSVIFGGSIAFLLVSLVAYLLAGMIVYQKGFRPAIYYLSGWGIYTFFSVWAVFAYTNILDFHKFAPYFTPTGVVLETIISSLALADRINVLKRENLTLISNQKKFLEEEVKKQTHEIEMQNKELQYKKEEMELLSNNLEIIVNQRTQELKQAMDNLTKQNQDLAQFSYIVSHNLRSPVARVLGLVGIFNESDYSDPYNKDIVAHLKKATTDLDTVIKDLTQIISVRNDLNKTKEKIFVLEIVQLEKFLLKDEIEKIKVIIQVIDLEDIIVFSIKSYVQSIIHNLISNAIKYRSPKRSPHIIIRATQDENSICISVQDNGLGMDLTEVDSYKIFGLYQRMHDHVEGKGMGLFLVKTQIESLGGKIEVDSKLDVGTTFRVYFPI
jgi:signal transduction histidine kinase